jgi:hypothetical protein
MRKSFATIGVTLAAAAMAVAMPALAASSASASQVPVNQLTAVPQQAASIQKAGAVRLERHPEIRKAIAALERAKTDLKRASHDFGGHRVEALEACDKAIEQLRLALQYDKR